MNRIKELKKNYSRIFWIEAFFYANIVNIIATLFYIHRDITLKQIFFLPIIYSITNIIFEIPSSYLADIWGRKKTIILSCFILALNYILAIFSQSFLAFSLVVGLYSLAIALLSGTSEALIYDTNIELKENKQSLKRLASLHSAKHIFKIITPLLTTLLVRDLSESQFVLIYLLNSIIAIIALVASLRLLEANHHLDSSKKQLGIFKDAINSIKNNRDLLRALMNRTIIFISSLITFLIFQKLFVDVGIAILTIGFIWSISHAVKYFIMKNFIKIFPKIIFYRFINNLNYISTLLYLACFLILEFSPFPLIALILFSFSTVSVIIRNPVFSEYFNHNSNSFNRATTLSLLNFSKSIFDIPIMFLSAFIVSQNINNIFLIAFILSVVTIIFFRIKKPILLTEK